MCMLVLRGSVPLPLENKAYLSEGVHACKMDISYSLFIFPHFAMNYNSKSQTLNFGQFANEDGEVGFNQKEIWSPS